MLAFKQKPGLKIVKPMRKPKILPEDFDLKSFRHFMRPFSLIGRRVISIGASSLRDIGLTPTHNGKVMIAMQLNGGVSIALLGLSNSTPELEVHSRNGETQVFPIRSEVGHFLEGFGFRTLTSLELKHGTRSKDHRKDPDVFSFGLGDLTISCTADDLVSLLVQSHGRSTHLRLHPVSSSRLRKFLDGSVPSV